MPAAERGGLNAAPWAVRAPGRACRAPSPGLCRFLPGAPYMASLVDFNFGASRGSQWGVTAIREVSRRRRLTISTRDL